MSKRPAAAAPGPSDPSGSDPEPGTKKQRIVFEPLQLGPIANLEELEVKTLAFQNQKLGLRLTQRIHMEEDLRTRIDQLEKRQTQDDALINIIHRYWNQLNEDIRILLQRFDAETCDDEETSNEQPETISFLTQLSTWQKQELDEKLASRVQVSQRAVAKIIQVFDHLNQRHERLSKLIRGDKLDVDKNGKKEKGDEEKENGKASQKEEGDDKEVKEKKEKKEDEEKTSENKVTLSLDVEVKELNRQLTQLNPKAE
jgi:E3 ubiquitin-protein ligase BRE1